MSSLLFEKRFWCQYLCPIGGMNGLFAKLAILELRAQAGTCSGSCISCMLQRRTCRWRRARDSRLPTGNTPGTSR